MMSQTSSYFFFKLSVFNFSAFYNHFTIKSKCRILIDKELNMHICRTKIEKKDSDIRK